MVTALPPEVIAEGLADVAGRLPPPSEGWERWCAVSPVSSRASEQIAQQELEQEFDRLLRHLRQVCRQPRLHLDVQELRLPAGHAHRISPRAIAYLAGHNEDWEQRRLQSVLPRRILAAVNEDRYDIYENRVVARLLDHLADYLQHRIRSVRDWQQELREAADTYLQAPGGTYRQERRLYTLLGEFQEAEDHYQTASKTLEFLQGCLQHLDALKDSLLYRAVPVRADVGRSLRDTNILVNDPHYRQVVRLWRLWQKTVRTSRPTRQELYDDRQRICRYFDAFCALLLCRALKDLGWEQSDPRGPARPGAPSSHFYRTGALGQLPENGVALTWELDGSLTLRRPNGKGRMHIVPLAQALTAQADETILSALHSELETSTARNEQEEDWTVLLYPTTPDERAALPTVWQLRFQTLGNEPLRGEGAGLGIIPVSPLSVSSQERVARALQWWLTQKHWLLYPPRVDCSTRLPPQLGLPGNWLAVAEDRKGLSVLAVPPAAGQQHWTAWLESQGPARHGNQSGAGRLAAPLLAELKAKLPEALRRLETLQVCPACGDENASLEPGERDSFRCRCRGCKCCWGLRVCIHCGQRYPFLQLGVRVMPPEPTTSWVGWVDRCLGRDVMAIPCLRSPQTDYICPSCGVCGARERERTDCQRCILRAAVGTSAVPCNGS